MPTTSATPPAALIELLDRIGPPVVAIDDGNGIVIVQWHDDADETYTEYELRVSVLALHVTD